MKDKNLIILGGGALIILLTVGILSMLVLSKGNNKSQSAQGNSYLNTGNSMVEDMNVMLSAQNASGQSGVASIKETNGTATVTLSLTGSSTNIAQPAHIHVGQCPGVGKVIHPLTSVVNGNSVTVLNVSIAQLKQQLPLAINVHKSAEEIATYTSCGAL